MGEWMELPFEIHSRPAPMRVWQSGDWFIDWSPEWNGHAYAFALARSLDPFAWCELFSTFDEASEYADYLNAEVND